MSSLGQVIAPSGAVVLACGGFLEEWGSLGEPLSVRAARAAETGGGALRDWLAEAVALPAGPGALTVTAETRPGAYDPVKDDATIAVLQIDLDLPWSAVSAEAGPVALGDLPVDPTGMVVGDARALDSWVGFLYDETVDGLADVMIGGKGERGTCAHFGVPLLPEHRGGVHGWVDLPVEVARERAKTVNDWAAARGHYQYMARVDLHSHHHLGGRAGWASPLGTGVIEVAGCPILCIAWSPIELQRFRGGRASGQVYPVTLEDVGGRAVLRWVIPAMEP